MIERAAQDNLVNRKATSLELLATWPLPGFTGTLVDLPEAKLARAPLCIAWIDDQPAVIFSIPKVQ